MHDDDFDAYHQFRGNGNGKGRNQANDENPPPCAGLEPRNDSEVLLCNDLGEAVIAGVAYPSGQPPPGGWPGVLLLHGSGGLFKTLDDGECSEQRERQFDDWAERLTDQGYAVVMPASFYSRGFCDWNEAELAGSLPPHFDKRERLILRTFDAAAGAKYLCDDPRVDCSRIATLGFSNGASTLLLLYHEDHSDCDDPRLHSLGELPNFVGGVAYYPGCGLHGELTFSLDEQDSERFFYPRAPVWAPYGSADLMLGTCESVRDPQVDIVADLRHVHGDLFDLHVYADVAHGFDGANEDDPPADRAASEDAQAATLAKLDAWSSE